MPGPEERSWRNNYNGVICSRRETAQVDEERDGDKRIGLEDRLETGKKMGFVIRVPGAKNVAPRDKVADTNTSACKGN